MNSVLVSKRNFPKQSKNDKFKKSSFHCNGKLKVMDAIETDRAIKIKDFDYNPQKSFVNNVMEAAIDKIQIGNYHQTELTEILPIELDSKLKRQDPLLLIDTRDVRTFKNGHLVNAELFNCTSRAMMIQAKKNWDKFYQRNSHFESVVIYNQKGEKNVHITDFFDHIRKDFDSTYLLTGGYESFIKYSPKGFVESSIPEEKIDQYHFSPTNETNRSTDVLNATMSEILPFLYLDEAYLENGKVLVHCWAGVSRSATIVAAYLLNHTKLSVLQTITYLQSKRSIVEPNFNFLGQLERYYNDLERGLEPRSKDLSFTQVEQIARKITAENERRNELKLDASNSSSSSSPNTPPPKPYFNFWK